MRCSLTEGSLTSWSSQILFALTPTEDILADLLVLINSVCPHYAVGAYVHCTSGDSHNTRVNVSFNCPITSTIEHFPGNIRQTHKVLGQLERRKKLHILSTSTQELTFPFPQNFFGKIKVWGQMCIVTIGY